MANILKKITGPRKKILAIGLLGALAAVAGTAHAMEGSYMEGGLGAGIAMLFEVISASIFWVLAGLISLTITTLTLQWLINNQTALINFDSDFITKGLGVTQGLADMLLILAFVLASFGIIFKYREFEAKKTVTTLVLVAIFTRFGSLIVKMMVDIGNVAINTIVSANPTLLWDATSVLLWETIKTAGASLFAIGGTALLYALPWGNIVTLGGTIYSIISAATVLMGTDNVATSLMGNATLYFATNFLIKWIFQIITCHILSGVYLTYIILFVSRIFWMQILAVISPLAIMAYALPQTRRFFNQWWGSLVKWTFLGVWTLFFLMLGLGSTGFIVPEDVSSVTGSDEGVFSLIAVNRYMLYYIFLICYLALVKDMADKESGMGSLFKGAMMGAGAMAFSHAIKPAANQAQKRAISSYMNKQAEIDSMKLEGRAPSTLDNLAMHGAGIMAKALDEKQLSNYRGVFSGDSAKTTAATEGISKSFNLGKMMKDPKSASDIGSLIKDKISEAGKDNTIEKVIEKATKGDLGVDEAIWAMKSAKSEDIPTLLESFGADTGKYLNYAIGKNMLTPSTIMSLGRNPGAFEASAGLREYLLKQDRGDAQARKVQRFFEGTTRTGSEADQLAENNKMVERAVLLKEATVNKKTFQGLSADVLGDENNLKAMLINAPENMLGFARESDEQAYEKMLNMIHNNFEQLAKSNPGLVKAIARKQGVYDQYIPNSVKASAHNIENDNLSYREALRQVVNNMTNTPQMPGVY